MIRLTSDSPTCWSGPAVCSTLYEVLRDVLTVINPEWSVWPPPLGNRTGKQHASLSWLLQTIDTMQLAGRKPSSVFRVIGIWLKYETVERFIVLQKCMSDLLLCLWESIPVKNNSTTLAWKFAENIMCRRFERLTERFVWTTWINHLYPENLDPKQEIFLHFCSLQESPHLVRYRWGYEGQNYSSLIVQNN